MVVTKPNRRRQQCHYTLAATTVERIAALAHSEGIPHSHIIDRAIGEYYERRGTAPQPHSPSQL